VVPEFFFPSGPTAWDSVNCQTSRKERYLFMGKKNQYGGGATGRSSQKRSRNDQGGAVRDVPVYVPKTVVEYGQPFIVMEDADKNTFAYDGSAWVPYAKSIADCKANGQVKVLPQKVNGKTRYEVRQPIGGR